MLLNTDCLLLQSAFVLVVLLFHIMSKNVCLPSGKVNIGSILLFLIAPKLTA
jgi:hypothetical protein